MMATKIKIKHLFTITLSMLLLLSCASSNESEADNNEIMVFEYDTTQVTKYLGVVEDVNKYGYVPFFRMFQKTNFNFEAWNLKDDESTYIQDSMAYTQAHETFFNQEKEFLYWLMDFKNDTVVDSVNFGRSLWKPFINPYLSSISPCEIHTSNSRQAINLIYGFLDGENIQCVECSGLGNHSCALPKYENVERFLNDRRDLNVVRLREEWEEWEANGNSKEL